MTHAAEHALTAQPGYILPIHDYHWKDEARRAFYQWLTSYFLSHNIKLLQPETGEAELFNLNPYLILARILPASIHTTS